MSIAPIPSVQHQLRAQLYALVDEIGVGGRLPPERELAEQWGVARMTLRRAMEALSADGVVNRRQGSGTYVTPRPQLRTLGLTSFHADMAARGLVPGTKVLSFRMMPATPALAGKLRIPASAPIFQFSRVRSGSGLPIGLETAWIPEQLTPGLTEADLGGSLYALLAERYDVHLGQAKVTIDPVLPDEQTRELLEIPADQACLRFSMVDYDEDGEAVMVATGVYRGDQYHLSVDIGGGSRSMGNTRAASEAS
ncbi:MAG: GntR family transcriptional regulator [Nocardioides sp.]